ncbi:calpain small subunit 2-like [Patiria miniata]|uniref:EF-hand domain-containing protein n=1 Tax=Patiria miniata TaxID=46514 RepID=A0A914BDE1_PATMI|nr:calpain small subunit 2-like [Patiria miniata]
MESKDGAEHVTTSSGHSGVTTSPGVQSSENPPIAPFYGSFLALAGDDGVVDAWDLQKALKKAFSQEFGDDEGISIDVCKSFVALYDEDQTGRLGFEEFKGVWAMVKQWKDVFTKYDEEKSGSLTAVELREALKSIGFSVSDKTFGSLALRFGNKKGDISFDAFVACVAKITGLTESSFHEKMSRGEPYNVDDFLAVGMRS